MVLPEVKLTGLRVSILTRAFCCAVLLRMIGAVGADITSAPDVSSRTFDPGLVTTCSAVVRGFTQTPDCGTWGGVQIIGVTHAPYFSTWGGTQTTGVTHAPFCGTWGTGQEHFATAHSAAQPGVAGLAMHCATVTAVSGQAPGLAAHRAAHPARPGFKAHWPMVMVPTQAPGVAEHIEVQPVRAGLMEHWAMVAAPPVHIGSFGLALHEAKSASQPTRLGVAVHCAKFTVGQIPGFAAQTLAHPGWAGLDLHCSIVTAGAELPVQIGSLGLVVQVVITAAQPGVDGFAVHCARFRTVVVPPVLPVHIGSVGLVGQVAMIWVHCGMVGVAWQLA